MVANYKEHGFSVTAECKPESCTACPFWTVDMKNPEIGSCYITGHEILANGHQDDERMDDCPIETAHDIKAEQGGICVQDLKIHDEAADFKVRNDSGTMIPTKVSINGLDVKCRSVHYYVDTETVPCCTVELLALGDIEVNHADILFRFTPNTVEDAAKILRHELLEHGYLYDSFAASIESSIKEQGLQGLPFQPAREIAEKILDRVIGIENDG